MKIITSLSLYLTSNIEHDIKLKKREQQDNIDIRGSPNMGYVHRKVASSIILKIDLRNYMASSHMHHIKIHHPIMSQSCVYKWHTQHVMCDELQSTHTQKGLLHLSYIPRDLDYNTSHNTWDKWISISLYREWLQKI